MEDVYLQDVQSDEQSLALSIEEIAEHLLPSMRTLLAGHAKHWSLVASLEHSRHPPVQVMHVLSDDRKYPEKHDVQDVVLDELMQVLQLSAQGTQ